MKRTAGAIAALVLTVRLPVVDDTAPELQPGDAGFETTVQVRYLGVGGFLVRLGHDAFMTAPLYSNPSAEDVIGERPIAVRPTRIARHHHPTRRPEDIRAILVGHAHYDHLMDVVPVWQALAQRPPIYGSLTLRHILAGYDSSGGPVKAGAVVALDDPDNGTVGDVVDTRSCRAEQPCEGCGAEKCPPRAAVAGKWVQVPGSRIRLLALCGAHPAQFLDVHKWPGCLHAPRTTPPSVPKDYPEGRVLAYLVDFLDAAGQPIFRVYYQDAPADAVKGWGMIPEQWLAERPVDLALLCAGNWNKFAQAERVAKASKSRHIVLGHWEDFFVPQDERLRPILTLNGEEFIKRLKAATGLTPVVPAPQVMMRFPL